MEPMEQRTKQLQQCEQMNAEIDLLVIGGGITGAGIALDAQSRGISTVLLEKQDFAAGTSSRSTKLVHGGLRYLKQLQFSLVAEVGKERQIVYHNAPHVTTPEWMLLPIIEGGTYGKVASSFGIWLYDLLAGVSKHERRQMLSYQETVQKEPLLRRDGLKGSGYYVEYRTDDARLTIEVIKRAITEGAKCFNYVEVKELLYEKGKLVGVLAFDHIQKQTYQIYAKKIVNATGPWVDQLREWDHSKQGKTLHLTKGVHIVVDQSKFPLKQAIYFDTPDDRMIFAIPRANKTYIGTTDTDYQGSLENPRITLEDRNYLLHAVSFMFPTIQLLPEDIESGWAGIRPLIHEEGKSPSEISRKDEIFHAPSGLITIAGGKLTGYRKMAEKVVNQVASDLEKEEKRAFRSCYTDQIRLSGGIEEGAAGWSAFLHKKSNEGEQFGLRTIDAQRLVQLYGGNVDRVFQLVTECQTHAAEYRLPTDVCASLLYGIQQEMVLTPMDFFIRRTGALYFHLDWMDQYMDEVLSYMRDLLHWSEEDVAIYRQQLLEQRRFATEAIE
ncbi:homodimeric glycerol 3-phosphate dehydrogenase (quinone) [Seinonella peptonophila]|uniref:Glycerol-3-phosphate dehydrogenase n=2 Tax=Seinonella peptonophila TaxID=112248 RepID=A0A1M5BNG7_9BACL|nr:homodimeric glycerol 3-phosphate dehydrogenase (quinone) [Seinonella peptonophila]